MLTMKSIFFVLPLLGLAAAAVPKSKPCTTTKAPTPVCPAQATFTDDPSNPHCPEAPMCKCIAPKTATVDCACPTAIVTVKACRKGCNCLSTELVHPTAGC